MELMKLTNNDSNYDALVIPFGKGLVPTSSIPEEV